MPRKSKRQGKRQSAFNVPGASVVHRKLTGKVTPFTHSARVVLGPKVAQHSIETSYFRVSEAFMSYKLNSVDIEVPPGIGASFRVTSNVNSHLLMDDSMFADPMAVTVYNTTTKRRVFRYKPTEVPYTGVQPSSAGIKSGLILFCCLTHQASETTEHELWIRYNVLCMDQVTD